MTAVRSHENIIKSPDQRNFPVGYLMRIDAEQLLGQLSLVDSVIMIDPACAAQQICKVEVTWVSAQSRIWQVSSQ